MPAAAVIPAPIAYIKVVAVKKLVVEFWMEVGGLGLRVEYFFRLPSSLFCLGNLSCSLLSGTEDPGRLL